MTTAKRPAAVTGAARAATSPAKRARCTPAAALKAGTPSPMTRVSSAHCLQRDKSPRTWFTRSDEHKKTEDWTSNGMGQAPAPQQSMQPPTAPLLGGDSTSHFQVRRCRVPFQGHHQDRQHPISLRRPHHDTVYLSTICTCSLEFQTTFSRWLGHWVLWMKMMTSLRMQKPAQPLLPAGRVTATFVKSSQPRQSTKDKAKKQQIDQCHPVPVHPDAPPMLPLAEHQPQPPDRSTRRSRNRAHGEISETPTLLYPEDLLPSTLLSRQTPETCAARGR